ncbi:hypothetical protein EJ05DRAFT_472792 [Pseudovirgaria hyperparasitica]|uniref:EB domain-containing protein n=1 Tax=Pseudovirgaria hyperparasitica TaxID=470096 RepID=A0A6A6WI99_9PEZI|nr:uncharacterized protein EJ05DRAFT_472792 [Pseudovirgaria hyperparasitica]KAF2761835.1 hypothetical protein EJ05DRAFT_472792 [Pseudovirgaria hyperparasitica]
MPTIFSVLPIFLFQAFTTSAAPDDSIAIAVTTNPQTPTSLPSYCTTAPSSVYIPTYTLSGDDDTSTPPLPCNKATYATQEGYCCSNGIACANGECTCPNGTLIYSLPLEPCVTLNPYYSGCPGNILRDLCCSGPGVFAYAEEYGGSMTTPQCWHGATQVWTRTTMPGGEVVTSTLPPGISYTETRCFTCPLYTRSSTGAAAMPTGRVKGDDFVVKIMAVIILITL